MVPYCYLPDKKVLLTSGEVRGEATPVTGRTFIAATTKLITGAKKVQRIVY